MLMKKFLILLSLVLSTPLLAADQTLTSLPAAGALGGTELLYCVQAAADTKCTPAQMSTFTAAATATLTNKTYDTAGVGNVFRINGTAIAAVTGTGAVVLGTAPTITLANGTGLPISTGVSGLGTGVSAALAVNVGTAGSPVINGGALGSPSSVGTLPAHTLGGAISGGGNQINNVVIGAVTPLAGSFTTVSAGQITSTQAVGGVAQLGLTNTDAGVNSYMSINYGNNAGAGVAQIALSSSNNSAGFGGAGSSLSFINNSAGGNIAFYTQGSGITRLQIVSTGGVFMSSLTAAAGTPNSICQNNATKEITVNAATSCVVSSLAYKHDFKALDGSVLPAILAMRPGSFYYNDSDRQRIGFASEYQAEVDPRLADGWDKDGHPRSLDQTATIAYLVRGMQELVKEIERLKAKR
jgi:hypothetical protein